MAGGSQRGCFVTVACLGLGLGLCLCLVAGEGPQKEELPETEVQSETSNYTRPWVPKCCGLNYGYTFENRSACVATEDRFLPEFADRTEHLETAKRLQVKARYEYFIGDPCAEGKYILDVTAYPYDQYSIYTNGTLLYLDQLYSKEEFCLETLNGTVRAFICFGSGKSEYEYNLTFIIYASGLLVSIPFLLVTALIHLWIELFRDLRGKSLSCHVLCLAIGYLVLAIVQLGSDQLHEDLCIAAGFIIQFFFVASFFWLNVICYETYRCINNDFRCAFKPSDLYSEKVTFWCYSLYGWYMPIMLSIATLIMDFEPAIPESYLKPNIGLKSCWFYSDDAALPYFYGPIGIVILVNVVLFALSARKIYKEQKRRAEMRPRQRDSMDGNSETHLSIRVYTTTLRECIYLFCIMGINWATEVISWAVGGSQIIWLVTDVFNALQGVMIFYLFILRPKRVRREVKKKLRETWKRLIKCDCSHEEENRRVSRHWHASIHREAEEFCFANESDKFLRNPKLSAV